MSLFWTSTPLKKAIASARAALADGDHLEALGILRAELPSEKHALDKKAFTSLLKALKPIGNALVGEDFSGQLTPAISKPNVPEILYRLGYDLIEYGLPRFATLPLYRLNQIMPGDPTVLSELCAALESLMMSEEIVRLLQQQESVTQDYMCRYLLAFHLIMCGLLTEARQHLPYLQETAQTDDEHSMKTRIAEMLTRADLIKGVCTLDEHDLVGWHFVKMGSILTHYSPYGCKDGMNGRYALIQDSFGMCKMGLERLETLLRSWNALPQRVFYTRDRSSIILAKAVAQFLKVEAESLNQATGQGLIVCYDLADLEGDDWERLARHHPGRPLFVHTLNWLDPPPISPDVVTYLHQSNLPPWASQMHLGAEGDIDWTQPDKRDEDLLAEKILAADSRSQADDDHSYPSQDMPLGPLAEVTREVAAFFKQEGFRERYWSGGPVKSAVFG